MTVLKTMVLGLIQGATEFLPISSSGHLVLTEALLGVNEGGLLLEVTLHAGTLLAVLVYYRRRIGWMLTEGARGGEQGKDARRWILWIVLGTLPAVIVGLGFQDGIARLFDSPRFALWGLIVTGAILISTFRLEGRDRPAAGPAGLVMGIAQAFSILPGVSRSGSTIAAGMWWGVNRAEAAEFSFLLSLPAIAGAMLLQGLDLLGGGTVATSETAVGLVAGFVVSFAAGYAAIAVLLGVLRRRGLAPFAWYCWAVGIIGLLVI